MAKVSHKINYKDLLPNKDLTNKEKKVVREEVSELLMDLILKDTSNQRSAVSGQRWKGLSKHYKKIKSKVAPGIANLELTGAMLDALKVKKVTGGFEVGVFGGKGSNDQVNKADGHCHTEVIGTSKLPKRQFIPGEEETFRSGIMKELVKLAKEVISEDNS